MSLTHKQAELLRYISGYQKASGGVSPSFDEMALALSLSSKSGVSRLLHGLDERNYIRHRKHRARHIEILRMPNASQVAAPPKDITIQSGNRCPHCDGVISIPFKGKVS
jgi:SOS-response transcriptional repressor LexA